MIFIASWALSARLFGLFQAFGPSNIVIRRVQTRRGLKWGPAVGLAGVVTYGLVTLLCTHAVEHGGSGWLNLVVLVAFGTRPSSPG